MADKKSKDKNFEIKGTTLVRYTGNDSMATVVIPDGITKIGKSAFKAENYTVTEIIMPEGVKTIEKDSSGTKAFAGCRKLKKLLIPDTIEDIPSDAFKIYTKDEGSDEWRYLRLDYNEYDNGLYLGNDTNPYVCLVEVIDESIESFTAHDGCKVICGDTFLHCKNLKSISLPDSIIKLEERSKEEWIEDSRSGRFEPTENIYLKRDLSINMPERYFQTTRKLPPKDTYDLLSTKWSDQVTLNDLAWIYLFQSSKKIDGFCEKKFTNKNQAVKEMIDVCRDNPSDAAIKKAAAFTYSFKSVIKKDLIAEVVQLADRDGISSDELDQLHSITGVVTEAVTDDLDKSCHEKYESKIIDDIISKSTVKMSSAFKKCPVTYKKTGKEASQFVIKCAIAQYIDSFNGNEPKAQIIESADGLASELDGSSFRLFIDMITERPLSQIKVHSEYWGIKPVDRLLSLAGRFGDERILDKLILGYEEIESENVGINQSSKVSNYQNYLRAAILLNDSEKALSYCVEKGWGKEYARIRGKRLYELNNNCNSDDDKLIAEAILLYEDIVIKIKKLVAEDGTYSEPTVENAPAMVKIKSDNQLARKFYSTLRDYYSNNTHTGSNDHQFAPDVLFENWINGEQVESGQIGISFPIGLLVASYMFESKDVRGQIVFCRNKWEYSGNASETTRIVLVLNPDANKWEVLVKSGYERIEM